MKKGKCVYVVIYKLYDYEAVKLIHAEVDCVFKRFDDAYQFIENNTKLYKIHLKSNVKEQLDACDVCLAVGDGRTKDSYFSYSIYKKEIR